MKATIKRICSVTPAAIAAGIFWTSPMNAQTLGIIGGANFEAMSDVTGTPLDQFFDTASGFHLGLFAQIGEAVALRPAALYLNAGTFVSGLPTSIDNPSLKFLAFPIDVKVSPIPLLYIMGGPEFQFRVSGGSSNIDNELTNFTVSGGIGAGVSLGKLFVEGRYMFGLNRLIADPVDIGGFTFTGADLVSNAVRVSAGIGF